MPANPSVLMPSIIRSTVVPAENPCESDTLFESEALTDGSYTWKTKLPAGTQAMIVVDDEAGNEAWSGAVSRLDYPQHSSLSDIFPTVYGWTWRLFVP